MSAPISNMKAPRESARLLGCEGPGAFSTAARLHMNERLVFENTSPPETRLFSQEMSHFCLFRALLNLFAASSVPFSGLFEDLVCRLER